MTEQFLLSMFQKPRLSSVQVYKVVLFIIHQSIH